MTSLTEPSGCRGVAGKCPNASATSTTTKQPGPDSQTTEVTQSGI